MSNDLWPDFSAKKIKSPKTILLEQATFFNERMKNVLIAEVKSSNSDAKKILHSFNIVSPALGNYKYNLFHVRHEILFYPLEFIELGTILTVKNESDLVDRMKLIFNSEKTINLIQTLYSQSE